MNTFNHGDTVFSVHGEQLEYIAQSEDGHIVRPIYEATEDGYQPAGKPRLEHQVFKTEPVQRYAEETAKAYAALKDARYELSLLQGELRNIKADREKALQALSKHPDLSVIIDWMEGSLTHLATIENYGPGIKIKTIKEAITPCDGSDAREGQVRLLSLYGGYGGIEKSSSSYRDNLYWQLCAYSDGSGSSFTRCILGTSVEDVKGRLQVWLDGEFKRSGNYAEHILVQYADSALNLGLNVPPGLAIKVKTSREQGFQNQLSNAERELKNTEAALEQCKQKVAALKAKQVTA